MSLDRRRRILRVTGLLAAACSAVLVGGCGSVSRPGAPDEAEAYVKVGPDGALRVDLRMPQRFTVSDLQRVSREVAAGMFASRVDVRNRVTYPRFGYPNATIEVRHAYRPGSQPAVAVDTAALQTALGAESIRRTSLSVCGPRVPVTIRAVPRSGDADGAHCAYWAQIGPLQQVTVSMRPEPGSWVGQLGLLCLTVLADAVALMLVLNGGRWSGRRTTGACLTGRRRGVAIGLGVAGVAAGLTGVLTGAGGAGDNMGVQGDLSGTALRVATDLPLLVLPLLAVSMTAVGFAALARRRRPTLAR